MSNVALAKIFEDIFMECHRQDEKWGGIDVQGPGRPITDWISILGEEYGELCQEANGLHWDPREDRRQMYRECLRSEAIQVAAVAVRIVECLDIGYV